MPDCALCQCVVLRSVLHASTASFLAACGANRHFVGVPAPQIPDCGDCPPRTGGLLLHPEWEPCIPPASPRQPNPDRGRGGGWSSSQRVPHETEQTLADALCPAASGPPPRGGRGAAGRPLGLRPLGGQRRARRPGGGRAARLRTVGRGRQRGALHAAARPGGTPALRALVPGLRRRAVRHRGGGVDPRTRPADGGGEPAPRERRGDRHAGAGGRHHLALHRGERHRPPPDDECRRRGGAAAGRQDGQPRPDAGPPLLAARRRRFERQCRLRDGRRGRRPPPLDQLVVRRDGGRPDAQHRLDLHRGSRGRNGRPVGRVRRPGVGSGAHHHAQGADPLDAAPLVQSPHQADCRLEGLRPRGRAGRGERQRRVYARHEEPRLALYGLLAHGPFALLPPHLRRGAAPRRRSDGQHRRP